MDLTLKLQHGGMSDVTPAPLRSRHIRFCSASIYQIVPCLWKKCSSFRPVQPKEQGMGYSRGGAYIYTSFFVFNMPMYCIFIVAHVYVYNAYIQAIETRKYT